MFARMAALAFLKLLRQQAKSEQQTIDVALGGGQSVNDMMSELLRRAEHRPVWMNAAKERFHLWTPTVGYPEDQYDRAPQVHAIDCTKALDARAEACHVLAGVVTPHRQREE
ncbi:MAG: hypothetical protein ACE5HV_17860, partial [Acidobacteriota bacterium]